MKSTLVMLALSILSVSMIAQTYSRKYDASENIIDWPDLFDPQKSDFYVHNEIEINASPESVWQLLVHAKNWPTWYDGIQDIRFEHSEQEKLTLYTKVFWRSMGQSLNNEITHFEANKSLAWQFNEEKIQGMHAWVIIPTVYGCKVITDESQNGRLARLQKIFIPRRLMKQHNNWLKLLKHHAEASISQLSQGERAILQRVLTESCDLLMESIAGLTEEHMQFKPAPRKWSIAECLEHVTLAELRFPIIVKEEMQSPSNPEKRSKIRIKDEDVRSKMLNGSWKAKAPESFKPTNSFETATQSLQAFKSQRLATLAYVEHTKDDLRNHFWKHPLTGTIDLYQTLLLMSAHLERHIRQIEGIKASKNFPI